MAEQSLAELYAKALAESGGGPSTILPNGQYRAKLVGKKDGVSKAASKPQYGLKWEILEGPYANQTCWTNQTLTRDNMQALGIFLSQLIQLGVDEALVRSGTVDASQLPNYVVKGIVGTLTLGSHAFGTDANGNPKLHQDLKGFKLESIPAVTVSPTGTPVIPTQAPVAAPIIPQPVAQPVVVQQPVYVQPAPVIQQAQPIPVVSVPPLPQAPVVAPAGTQVSF